MSTKKLFRLEETDKKILDTAQRMFSQDGFVDTQMTTIAKELGISRTSLYRYYPDKFELGLTILQRILDTKMNPDIAALLEGELAKAENGLEKIKALLEFCWGEDHFDGIERYMAEFDAYFTSQRVSDEGKEKLRNKLTGSYVNQVVIKLIKEGVEDGSIDKDLDIELTCNTVLNAVRSLKHRLLLRRENLVELDGVDNKTIINNCINLFIYGLQNK